MLLAIGAVVAAPLARWCGKQPDAFVPSDRLGLGSCCRGKGADAVGRIHPSVHAPKALIAGL